MLQREGLLPGELSERCSMADPNGLAGVPEPAHAPLQPGASAAPMPQPPLQVRALIPDFHPAEVHVC